MVKCMRTGEVPRKAVSLLPSNHLKWGGSERRLEVDDAENCGKEKCHCGA